MQNTILTKIRNIFHRGISIVLVWLALGAATSSAAIITSSDVNNVPVDYHPVAKDMLVPTSDSVRAATWDELESQPSEPVQVRVACMVFMPFGAPGSCVAASRLGTGQTVANWPKLRDEEARAQQSGNQADVAIRGVAEDRISTLRLAGDPSAKPGFVIRIFDEVVSPADARPHSSTSETLGLNDVTLTKPIDFGLIKALYPPAGLRYSVSARVALQCRIEATRKLLCRELGTIQIGGGNFDEDTKTLQRSFRFATYQLASTLQLNSKSRAGEDVTGRNLRLAITWAVP